VKDLPQYGKGRWDGRDGRPKGCPGKDFPYDPSFSFAVANHRWPAEVNICVHSHISGSAAARELEPD
jgi:hypothetical protein